MASKNFTLSALDQSPVREGGTAAEALRDTIALAEATEKLGYKRFWVASIIVCQGSRERVQKSWSDRSPRAPRRFVSVVAA